MAESNPICSIDDCNRKCAARGLCGYHHRREMKAGRILRLAFPETCLVDGCENKCKARGLCAAHYQLRHRAGYLVTKKKSGVCLIDGCSHEHYSIGFCSKHYARLKAHGDPMRVLKKGVRARELADRFDENVMPEPNSGCWLWVGHLTAAGYGKIGGGKAVAKAVFAHRYSFERVNGPIPAGMHVCHRCDVRMCVNPDHLWLGTCADNHADRDRKGRQARGVSNSNAKFTEEDVRSIRLAHQLGEKPYALSRRWGVSPSTIHNIVDRKTWKHVA